MASKKNKKSLVIVESPAKAETINKIVGSDYVVKACMGHVRDLPSRKLGIDIENNFTPTYITAKGKGKILAQLRSAAKDAGNIYLATDPDREGEAIAWHLAQALKIPSERTLRVTFNEITKKGVLDGFKNPTSISIDRVNAQQARRLLDRIVGYKISPLLWKKIGKGLSAGRVQSVTVRLIVEREKEINAFKPDEYWEIKALLNKLDGSASFTAELTAVDGKEIELKDGAYANKLSDEIRKEKFTIANVSQKEREESPPPPLTTSLLQQQASTKLGFSAKKTMLIAQQLYEGVNLGAEGSVGLITYMRTDSFRVANDAIESLRAYIKTKYGEEYLSKDRRVFASKKSAQDAHEAIRPTYVENTPDAIKPFLTHDQYRLYRLIWNRFTATQMRQAKYLVTNANIKAGRTTFIARGRELKFDGYTVVAGHKLDKNEQLLPPLKEGEEVKLKELTPSQHFTEPPPRYTEASLVKTLEKFGIGRPSTYAPIVSTIQDRGYVKKELKKLSPTELGIMVTEKLISFFDDIINVNFTAGMEEKLDKIEEATAEWTNVLKEFYVPFLNDLEKAKVDMDSEKGMEPEVSEICDDEKCGKCNNKCGKPMLVRWNRFGKFLGCSGFPECRNTKSLLSPEIVNEKCDKCGAQMVIRASKRGRFLACSKYPECKNTRPLQYNNKSRFDIPKDFDIKCDKCGSNMVVKYGRRGGFLACPGYPDCKNTLPFPKEWVRKDEPTEQDDNTPDTPQEDTQQEDEEEK